MNMNQVTISHSTSHEVINKDLIGPADFPEGYWDSIGALKMTLKADETKKVIITYDKELWEDHEEYRKIVLDMALERLADIIEIGSPL